MICPAYCLSRAYILIEDLVNLRALPLSAYVSINWSGFSTTFLVMLLSGLGTNADTEALHILLWFRNYC